MINSKFFTLLRTLQREEAQGFHRHLKQQHGEDIALQVFEYIKRHLLDLQAEKKLEIAYAYQKVFGVVPTDNARKKMLNTLSDLHLWLKDFLLYEKVRHETVERQLLWLSILQERGLAADFSKQATRLYQKAKNAPKKKVEDFLQEQVAGHFYYQHLLWQTLLPEAREIQECLDTLDRSTEVIRLKMALELTNLKKNRPSNQISENVSSDLNKEVSPDIQKVNSTVLLDIYREITQLLEKKEEIHFTRLEKILTEHANDLEKIELHGIIRYLHMFAAQQIRNGHEAVYDIKLHQLNQFGLQHDFFTQKGVMSATEFTNIVNVACAVEAFDWADAFVDHHEQYLPDEISKDTALLAKASILFETGEFEQSLEKVNATTSRDIHHLIRSGTLILRIYFELAYETRIEDYCNSFEVLLRRTPKPHTEAVKATIKFVRLVRALYQEKTDKQTLLDEIEPPGDLFCRKWLRAKAKHYKARSATNKRRK